MKKACFFIYFLINGAGLIAQESFSFKDSDLQQVYKQMALRGGYSDPKEVIRKWNTDIKIFAEEPLREDMKALLDKTIADVSPLVGNIKIEWTTDKGNANYLIKFDTTKRSGNYYNWDIQGNLYSGYININTNEVFNYEQQNKKLRYFFLNSLGHFSFKNVDKKNTKFFNCSLASWKSEFTELDKQIIQFHYSDAIKVGMDLTALEKYFKKMK